MASSRSSDVLSRLVGPAYAIAFLFALEPIVDTFAQVWPPVPGNPSWRFGLVGVGSNYLISILFGLFLFGAVAATQWHRRTLRVLAVLDLLVAVALIGALLTFALDALQLRPGIPSGNAQALRTFDIGAEKAVLKYLLSTVAALWMGLACWVAARGMKNAKGDEDVPRLVGQQAEKR